jgi:thiamine kinase-like enzyme
MEDIKLLMHDNSVAVNFHGDFQFDNIISTLNSFTLIDWRESFGNQSEWGDMYYDLAKLYGGLILNYGLIKENRFSFIDNNGSLNISVYQDSWQSEAREIFKKYIIEKKFNFEFIKKLTALIFLNMAPLHHAPFDKLLYSLSFLQFKGINIHD